MKIFEITLLFLGSVIGAGFATGAELITFFGNLHLPTWCIASIVGITILAIISLEIMLYYPTHNQTSFNRFTNLCSIIVYFILFTAMTAGVTAIANSGLALLSLVLSAIIVLLGFDKLSRLNTVFVLLIIILVITTALPHLFLTTKLQATKWIHLPYGIISAFLYAGLNCFMFPELIKAAALKQKKRTLYGAALTTSIFITILVGLILTTIKQTGTTHATIPLLAAAPNPITVLIILLAIITSQYTALFAMMQRYKKIVKKNRSPLLIITGFCLLAFITSFCGFNQIINFAYPLIGAFTCFFLLFSWQRLQV